MRTYISKEEQTTPGFKVASDQVAVMLPGNANKDYKQKHAIFHADNLRALRGFLKSSLLIYWWSMKKGWMSGPVFTEWSNDQLHCELKAYCKAKNMDLKDFSCVG
jgi:hypothetical protein